jgi:hypothetical protein
VAGDADDGLWQAGCGVKLADLGGRELAGGCGQMDAGGCDGDGDVGAGVDEELRRLGACAEGGEQLAGEGGEFAGWEVLLAELDKIKAAGGVEAVRRSKCGPAGGVAEERGLALGFVPGETGAVGDGVAEGRMTGDLRCKLRYPCCRGGTPPSPPAI